MNAWRLLLCCVMLPPLVCGCGGPADDAPRSTPAATRVARRAFQGAPPVIPHPPLGAACVSCHTETGKPAPPIGFAPANPHARTDGLSAAANCRQCHVFSRRDDLFAENDFRALFAASIRGERLHPGAPPVMPHGVFMRENCQACHAVEAGRPEIRCSHPERVNCRQCHVPRISGAETLAVDFGG